MKWIVAWVLSGLVLSGAAQAAPLEKLAVHQPYEAKPLTMVQAKRAALRLLRAEGGTAPRIYRCVRRTRYVVDCNGDVLEAGCDLVPGEDLLLPCAPGTVTTDTVVALMRIRSRLGFVLASYRR